MINAGFNYTKNNVSSVSISDQNTGKSASTYTNLDGSWTANLSLLYKDTEHGWHGQLAASTSRKTNVKYVKYT